MFFLVGAQHNQSELEVKNDTRRYSIFRTMDCYSYLCYCFNLFFDGFVKNDLLP